MLAPLGASSAAIAEGPAEAPRLVLLICVDQLRRDRITADLPGDLGRLVRDGRRYLDNPVDHGITNTCPGHATLVTGVQPARAGITSNDYIDRKTWASRYCAEDDYKDESDQHGRASAHPLNTGEPKKAGDQIYDSPCLDTATLALARLIIEQEALGQDIATDLLANGLSGLYSTVLSRCPR